ncbi:ABC transporter ATP-binding protein [Aeromicrobium sp. CTD01-1L150]|uniref:ABC transporter ATP-binding protein n=1 Tax=Aeromicrobium sp. CTD01-1L150 TaxID=3341830 RepID=UPI0035C21BDC
MAAPITIRDLSMTFRPKGRPETHALRGIDLTIAGGEFVAIVGVSGCGKTTLLRILAGLTVATEGEVRIGDRRVDAPHQDVSMMFQAPTLLPWRRIFDNVMLPLDLRTAPGPAEKDKVTALLDNVGLGDFHDRYPHELSGGMQQRAALCRALMTAPDVLLLDEPFGALDAMTRDQMNLDLNAVWRRQRVTTVLITHSISEAVFLAKRVVVMSPRPGRVTDVIDVPLPDERSAELMGTPEFTRTVAKIRTHFQGDHATVGALD